MTILGLLSDDNLPSEESEAVSSSDDDDGGDDDDDDSPIYIKRIKRAAKKAYDEGTFDEMTLYLIESLLLLRSVRED